MTDFTWDISFQLTGTYQNSSLQQTFNVPATVTGTIVTDIDSGFLNVEQDFVSWSFTYSAPPVGFAGSASGGPTIISLFGNVLSASGDTLSYVFDPNIVFANHIFFNDANDFFEQVDFGISLAGHDFVQGDIQLSDGLVKGALFDATVTQPFQIGTEVVATLADVSEVGTGDINLDLSAIFNVAGDVTISDNDQLVSIDLRNLLSVGGNFTLTDNGALLAISLPSLASVNGSVSIDGDTSAINVDLGSLNTAGGNVDISGDTSATDVNLGNLSTANGSVSIDGDTSAINVNLGSLNTVGGNVDISGDTGVFTIDLSALLQAGAILISDNGVVTLDLSALVQAGGDVSITGNTHLLTVDLPSLTSVDGNLDISDNTSATAIDVGSLTTVSGSAMISGDTSVTTIDAGSLTTVSGDFTISGDSSATTIDAGSLTSVSGSVSITDNTSATTVDASNLTSSGSVDISGNTDATTIDAGSVATVSGSVSITDNTSATTIDAGSLTTVSDDVTINSGADATLDASGLGPRRRHGEADRRQSHHRHHARRSRAYGWHADHQQRRWRDADEPCGLVRARHRRNRRRQHPDRQRDGEQYDRRQVGRRRDDRRQWCRHLRVRLQRQPAHGSSPRFRQSREHYLGGCRRFDLLQAGVTASITAWKVWDNALTTYANSQADNTGGDEFTAFTNSNPVARNVGTIKLIDGYFHDHDATVTDVAGDGFDTITNFAS